MYECMHVCGTNSILVRLIRRKVNIFILQVFYAELHVQWVIQRPLLQLFPYSTWNFGGSFGYTENAIPNFVEFFESLLYAFKFFTQFSSPQDVTKWQEYFFWWFLCERGGNALFKCGVTSKLIFACLDPFSWTNAHILISPSPPVSRSIAISQIFETR